MSRTKIKILRAWFKDLCLREIGFALDSAPSSASLPEVNYASMWF